ncbi:MAG: hypothetical protein WC824_02395 [Bacteroidota bacterium]|jgi:hypothetical protein
MPTPEQILAALQQTSAQYRILAVVWHLLFGAAIIAIVAGYRPTRRTAAVLLTLPLLSVSVIASIAGNPFNGGMFGIFWIGLFMIAKRMPASAVEVDRRWLLSGSVLIIFGWIYPHFFTGDGAWHYIATAPLGVVPCPTLSMLIGATILFGGFASRSWMRVLGAAGLLYGVFGAFRLGVTIDIVLLAAALLLLYISVRQTPPVLR